MEPVKDDRTAVQLIRQYDQLRKIKSDLIKEGQLNGDASVADVLKKLREILPVGMFVKSIAVFFLLFVGTASADVVCRDDVCSASPQATRSLECGSASHAQHSERRGLLFRFRHAREERRARRSSSGLMGRLRHALEARTHERIEAPPGDEFHRPAAPGV